MFKPRGLRHPSTQDIQETSATIVSQPAANKTSPLKRPHPGDNLDESINTSKKKKVQTSLNVYFKKWKWNLLEFSLLIWFGCYFFCFNYVICIL